MDLQKEISALETALTRASENEIKTEKLLAQAKERRAFVAGQLNAVKQLAAQQHAEKQMEQTHGAETDAERAAETVQEECRAGI